MSSALAQVWSLHVAATVAMAGALWVVQLAIYPLFSVIGRAEFPDYHRIYVQRMGIVVGPLMLLEAGTAVWLWSFLPASFAFVASLGLLAAVWLSTFAVQVPLHRRLADGYAPALHRRLVWSNWIRTLAWTARAALVLTITR
ncbi:hypothetical protein ESB00_00110 [Oleiharenicola lentus]|uniref:DUF1772 domain-containing protein n=1 Tax=Oleiharenicola lentus TaxID=2508720 RepID=A0A4Q1C652_9BACT|nr:hypothetical protein [Oleiharenicola lentus]RXK54345.1 hypothetical protein ESB00_00110 [Oleiharenicola lentus]